MDCAFYGPSFARPKKEPCKRKYKGTGLFVLLFHVLFEESLI